MTKKKIYIDLTSFYNMDFLSGIQRVVREVVTRLLKYEELEVILFTWLYTDEMLSVLSNDDFIRCYDEGIIKKSEIRTIKKIGIDDLERGSVLFDIDSTWDSRCHSRYEVLPLLSKKGVLIASYIHDVLPITNPEFWPCPIPLFYGYVAANICNADCLITSVNETVTKLGVIAKNTNAVLPPCSVSWLGSDFKAGKTADMVSEKAKNAVSKGKYILCVGSIERRKNHKIVLDAYDKKLNSLGINLVFAGRRAEGVDELLARMDSHPNKNNGFYFLEGENDVTIDYLYHNAWMVVFPTFDEGFGLPLVESLLHGAVTVTSDIPVMREVGGDACDYFDPKDVDSLIRIVSEYLESPEKYKKSKSRANGYKPVLWGEVAEKIKNTLVVIEKDEEREKKMKDISVEQIMQEIRDDIAAKGYKAGELNFSDYKKQCDEKDFGSLLLAARSASYVDMYANVSGGKCKSFIKKVIRKLIRPVLMSQAERQTKFNESAIEAIAKLEKYASALEARISLLEKGKR
jgi:glycosyltransferase involved in cell wall biosynthesis